MIFNFKLDLPSLTSIRDQNVQLIFFAEISAAELTTRCPIKLRVTGHIPARSWQHWLYLNPCVYKVEVRHKSRGKNSSDDTLRQEMRKLVDLNTEVGRIVLISGKKTQGGSPSFPVRISS
jgi:hypothetical protein